MAGKARNVRRTRRAMRVIPSIFRCPAICLMCDSAALLADDCIGSQVVVRHTVRHPPLCEAFERSAESRRAVRSSCKRKINFTELLLTALAEWRRPDRLKLSLAEINDNPALLAPLRTARPRAVVSFRAGLLNSPATPATGAPFYTVHATKRLLWRALVRL